MTATESAMPERVSICPKCNTPMQPGFLPDNASAAVVVPTWIPGKPSVGWFGVRLKGKRHYPVATYRCEKCGYLESYAAID
jgi:RNase P subunit RPR2